MAWFPVVAEERDDVRAALGIALPPGYERPLLSPAIAALLRHPMLGALSAGSRMADFVALTLDARRSYPGFPVDGVVATAPQGRYFRFWRPDPAHPDRLGEMRFTWDTVTQRASEDCTNAECLALNLEVLASGAPNAFAAVGMPLPVAAPAMPVVQVQPPPSSRAVVSSNDDASDFGSLRVVGTSLTICDVAEIPDRRAHVSISVSPGDYDVSVHWSAATPSGPSRVKALQLLRRGTSGVEVCAVKTVDVDTGALAVWDRQAFFRQVAPNRRESAITELAALSAAPAIATVGRSASVVVTPAGAGDGRYPVTLLQRGVEVVGVRVTFTLQ